MRRSEETTRYIYHIFTYALFSDEKKENALLPETFTPIDNAFQHSWTNSYFYGNPDYSDEFIKRTLTKALWDFSEQPFSTKFMFIVPNWTSASWFPLIKHFDIKKIYAKNTPDLFSAENLENLNPTDVKFTIDNRSFIGPTKWEVLVLFKDANTLTKIDGIIQLHLMFGHKSAKYIQAAIAEDKELLKLIGNDIKRLDVPIFCAVCHAAKSKNAKALREFPLFSHKISTTPSCRSESILSSVE